jgi:hypothetical protein
VDEERNAIAEDRLAVLKPSSTRELETRAGRRRQVQKDFGLRSIDNRRAFSRYAMQEMLKAASKRALSTPLPQVVSKLNLPAFGRIGLPRKSLVSLPTMANNNGGSKVLYGQHGDSPDSKRYFQAS